MIILDFIIVLLLFVPFIAMYLILGGMSKIKRGDHMYENEDEDQ